MRVGQDIAVIIRLAGDADREVILSIIDSVVLADRRWIAEHAPAP